MDAHHPSAEQPEDAGAPFTPRQLRTLKIAVVVMGLILVVGFAAVIGRIVYLLAKGGTATPAATARALAPNASLPLPAGATVRSIALTGDRLAVHYDTPAGAGVAILDLVTGAPLTHVDLKPK